MSSASLDRLKRLDASGGLDDQQGVRREVIPGVESLLRFSQAAQRRERGREGISDAVQAAARRLCALRAKDPDALLAQALEKEPASLASLEHDLEFKILREDPTIRTLITLHTEKAKAQAEARK